MAGENIDVYICHHDKDESFASFLTDHLEQNGLTVWKGEQTHKGKALVEAKVSIVVLSLHSTQSKECEDAVSLAYISDKPVFPVALRDFVELEKELSFSMKLILAKLNWVFFIRANNADAFPEDSLPVLTSSIRREIEFISEEPAPQLEEEEEEVDEKDEDEVPSFRRRAFYKRWNSVNESVISKKDFWEENFGDQQQVFWTEFKQAFLATYADQIKLQMPDDKVQWIVNTFYGEVLHLKKIITKKFYDDFCGDSEWGPDRFFLRVMDYTKGTIAMRGVFNMKSTVRLDAVQNLGQFKTAPVIKALMSLLDDPDANMRAVAAIALGRTEIKSRRVVSKLISKLDDEDRLVREATCLSLGKSKALSAVPHLVKRWRSDLISDVRAAAEVALGLMESEEANEALQVTHVLAKEMNALGAAE